MVAAATSNGRTSSENRLNISTAALRRAVLRRAVGKPLNAVENLGHGDRSNPELVMTMSEHPRLERRWRARPSSTPRRRWCRRRSPGKGHHVVKSTARGGADRVGTSRSIPPSSPKRSTSAPRTPSSSPGSRTASTRMARISASIERPWAAARIRNRSRTVSSKFRMLTAATAITSGQVLAMLSLPVGSASCHEWSERERRGIISLLRLWDLRERLDMSRGR